MTGAVEAIPTKAPAGVNGGLISTEYRFSTSTVDGDPGAGRFRYDNAILASVTEIFIDEFNNQGVNVGNFLGQIAAGDRLYIQQENDASNFAIWNVTVDAIDEFGWFSIGVTLDAGGSVLSNNARCLFVWQISGADFVTKVGTPVADQVAFFAGPDSIEGDDDLQWSNGGQGRLEIKCVANVVNDIGFLMIDPDSVLNPDGWQFCTGQSGIHDGTLILSHKPLDVVANRDVTFIPGARPAFGFGIATATDTALGDESAGSLAFFQPRDTTGREETKISGVGFVGGTGHEGVISFETYNYGDAGLQFARQCHMVVDADYTLHTDFYGRVIVGNTALNAPVESGDNSAMGYSQDNGMELTGQGTINDFVIFDDTHQLSLSKPTGSSGFRFHQRFAPTRFTEIQQGNPDFSIVCEANVVDFLVSGYSGLFRISSKLDVVGDLDISGYTRTAVVTDAELNAIANIVNTNAGKVQGAQLYNGTQNVPVWAVGNADGDVWVDGAGATVNTPV